MNLRKYLRILILSMCFMGLFPARGFAAGDMKPDLDRSGSISVTIKDKDRPVAGGSLLLYQVALLQEAENPTESAADDKTEAGLLWEGMQLTYSEDFAGCGIDLGEEDVSKLTKALVDYCSKEKLAGEKLPIGPNGTAKADKLPIGLYLIVQDSPAAGYEAINPFLLMIPYVDGDELIYDVDASPKVETKKEETPPETTPENPPDTPPHHNPPGKLPQTGQLWWPVILLAASGMFFFMIGWAKRNSDK